jgi:hypothetical protein
MFQEILRILFQALIFISVCGLLGALTGWWKAHRESVEPPARNRLIKKSLGNGLGGGALIFIVIRVCPFLLIVSTLLLNGDID